MGQAEIKQSLGQSLRKARRAKDITQQEVADAIGCEVNYYAKIERGKAIPSIQLLEKIVKLLDVTATELIGF